MSALATSSSSARTGGRGRRTGARACPSQPRARPRRSSHPKRHRAQAAPASSVPATARCSIKSAMLRPPRVDSSRYELPCHLRPLPQLSVRLLLTRSIVPLAARAAMAVPRTSAVSPLPGLLLKRESEPARATTRPRSRDEGGGGALEGPRLLLAVRQPRAMASAWRARVPLRPLALLRPFAQAGGCAPLQLLLRAQRSARRAARERGRRIRSPPPWPCPPAGRDLGGGGEPEPCSPAAPRPWRSAPTPAPLRRPTSSGPRRTAACSSSPRLPTATGAGRTASL